MTEGRKLAQARYREKNKEKLAAYQAVRRMKAKTTVFAHYGEECVECGFSDIRALHIDHIDNDGAVHRQELGSKSFSGWRFYEWLIKNEFPEGFQTLCANCNNIKQWELHKNNSMAH